MLILFALLGLLVTARAVEIVQSPSPSQSQSQGTCPTAGVLSIQPNGTAARDISYKNCGWMINSVDNTYGVRSVAPCIFPGGPVLAPTDISLQLSTGGDSDHGNYWISVFLAYNYSYFHNRNPRGVPDCNNEPTEGPHNPPFLAWTTRGSAGTGCSRICTMQMYYRVQCSTDYASAKSGKYYIEIPNVGRFNVQLSICIDEKFSNDYATECIAEKSECPQWSATTLDSAAAPDAPYATGIVLGALAAAALIL